MSKCIICPKIVEEEDGIICNECFEKILVEGEPVNTLEFKYDKPPKDNEEELKKYIKLAKEEESTIRLYMIHHFYGPMRGMFIDVKPDIELIKEIIKDSFKDILMKNFWNKTGLLCNIMIHSKVNTNEPVVNNIKEAEEMLKDKINKAPSTSKNTWYFRTGKLL